MLDILKNVVQSAKTKFLPANFEVMPRQCLIVWGKSNLAIMSYIRNPCRVGGDYSWQTGSVSWLLMPWLLPSPGHQQPWYWQCEMSVFLYSVSVNLDNHWHFGGLVQERRISSANALELRLSCTKPLISLSRNDVRCKYIFMFPGAPFTNMD